MCPCTGPWFQFPSLHARLSEKCSSIENRITTQPTINDSNRPDVCVEFPRRTVVLNSLAYAPRFQPASSLTSSLPESVCVASAERTTAEPFAKISIAGGRPRATNSAAFHHAHWTGELEKPALEQAAHDRRGCRTCYSSCTIFLLLFFKIRQAIVSSKD